MGHSNMGEAPSNGCASQSPREMRSVESPQSTRAIAARVISARCSAHEGCVEAD
jgi:hypothetical protein